MCHIVPICHFSVDLEFSHILCHIICICVVSVLCHIVLICVELKFITYACIEVITHAHRMLLCILHCCCCKYCNNSYAVVEVRIVVGWWRRR
jgi:hypothetical protein